MKKYELTNQIFGDLTVIKKYGTFSSLRKNGKIRKEKYWECICKCGNTTKVCSNYLISGHTKSCGCHKRTNPEYELKNNIFIDENQCWNWKGPLSKGYGRLAFEGKNYRVHRLSYITFIGQIPKNKIVCHTCDNPKCVNPEHLYAGTAKENTHDMVNRKRQNLLYGENHQNSKFTKENVLCIREIFQMGFPVFIMSKLFEIHPETIRAIVKRKTWSHI